MVIIHDVIEIDAGDTYAYDEAANKSKRERELKAADRIFSILPEEQKEYFRGLWDEFEEKAHRRQNLLQQWIHFSRLC